MKSETINRQECHILYDPALFRFKKEYFDLSWWQDQSGVSKPHAGRGTALIVDQDKYQWVLRRYHRGGMVAKLLGEHYLCFQKQQWRSFNEFNLLSYLYEHGFPVPKPIAALAEKYFIFHKFGLITKRIDRSKTLVEYLKGGQQIDWNQLGALLAKMHNMGVDHADLNAHNILIDHKQQIYIIDFDKGRIRSGGKWAKKNIMRLHRSLEKLTRSGELSHDHWREEWGSLMTTYDKEFSWG
ncbi:MAG: 3-deoxy-D-manno-octulosonic acid kinase [bacterium]